MMRTAAGAAVLAFVLSGCSEPTATERPAAPVSLRATVVLEPPRLEIGETASVEVVVATPPDHAGYASGSRMAPSRCAAARS